MHYGKYCAGMTVAAQDGWTLARDVRYAEKLTLSRECRFWVGDGRFRLKPHRSALADNRSVSAPSSGHWQSTNNLCHSLLASRTCLFAVAVQGRQLLDRSAGFLFCQA